MNFIVEIENIKRIYNANQERFAKPIEIQGITGVPIDVVPLGNLHTLINIFKLSGGANINLFPEEDLRLDFSRFTYQEPKNKFCYNNTVLSCYSPALKFLWLRSVADKTLILNGIALIRGSAGIERKYNKDLSQFNLEQTYEAFRTLGVSAPANFNLFKHALTKYKQFVKAANVGIVITEKIAAQLNFKSLVGDDEFATMTLKDLNELIAAVDHIYKVSGYKKANIFVKLFLYLTTLGIDTYTICALKNEDIDLKDYIVHTTDGDVPFDKLYSDLFIDCISASGKLTTEVGMDKELCIKPDLIEVSDFLFKRTNFKVNVPNEKRIYRYITVDALSTLTQLQDNLPAIDPYKLKNITRFAAGRITDNEHLLKLERHCAPHPLTYDVVRDYEQCSVQSAYHKLSFYEKWKEAFNINP